MPAHRRRQKKLDQARLFSDQTSLRSSEASGGIQCASHASAPSRLPSDPPHGPPLGMQNHTAQASSPLLYSTSQTTGPRGVSSPRCLTLRRRRKLSRTDPAKAGHAPRRATPPSPPPAVRGLQLDGPGKRRNGRATLDRVSGAIAHTMMSLRANNADEKRPDATCRRWPPGSGAPGERAEAERGGKKKCGGRARSAKCSRASGKSLAMASVDRPALEQ